MAAPERIASLLSSATEILYGIGLGDRVVAISHECDYPPEALDKPRVTVAHVASERSSQAIDDQVRQLAAKGAPLYGIDQQRLCELRPQLIVTQAQCDVCAVRYEDVLSMVRSHAAFRDTAVVALNPLSLDDIFHDVASVGEATQCREAAEQFAESLRGRVEAIAAKTRPLAAQDRPRVACIEWIEPLMLAANWTPQLIELAGGDNSLTKGGRHSSYSNWDQVIAYDPQVLVITPCGFDLARTIHESQVLPRLAGWNELSAVKDGRVFAVDGNAYFNRSGPRIVDSLEILAHLLHATRFSAPLSPAARHCAWSRLVTDGEVLLPTRLVYYGQASGRALH
jgi:iron complex transport system substrate-binding protein